MSFLKFIKTYQIFFTFYNLILSERCVVSFYNRKKYIFPTSSVFLGIFYQFFIFFSQVSFYIYRIYMLYHKLTIHSLILTLYGNIINFYIHSLLCDTISHCRLRKDITTTLTPNHIKNTCR